MIGKLILKKIFGVPDKKRVFLPQQIPPRLSTMRTTVGLLVYMHMEYANLPLGTANLLANLQNGGLAIMDERKAFAFLENVSYFRYGRKLVETNLTA